MLLSIIVAVAIAWTMIGSYIFSQMNIEGMSSKSVISASVVCGPLVWFCMGLVLIIEFINGE